MKKYRDLTLIAVFVLLLCGGLMLITRTRTPHELTEKAAPNFTEEKSEEMEDMEKEAKKRRLTAQHYQVAFPELQKSRTPWYLDTRGDPDTISRMLGQTNHMLQFKARYFAWEPGDPKEGGWGASAYVFESTARDLGAVINGLLKHWSDPSWDPFSANYYNQRYEFRKIVDYTNPDVRKFFPYFEQVVPELYRAKDLTVYARYIESTVGGMRLVYSPSSRQVFVYHRY